MSFVSTLSQVMSTSTTPIEWRLLYDAPCSLYTHPRQLAARALLSGHQPPPLEGARILEIGSALGGNLTPIAGSLPNSKCIGIDPFVEQTEQAIIRAQKAGIHNVTYLPIGVEELDQVEGEFDYIICHGLLSWIPPHAQHETLALCARRLSPQGLAYLSYNTYPKWHQLMYVRHALRWRGRHLKQHEAFEEEARRGLAFFAEHASSYGAASTRAIFSESHQNLLGKPDYYLAHEYLLEENHPFYFHEVVERVAQAGGSQGHGLCYLADLSLNVELAYTRLKMSVLRELKMMGDHQLAFQQNLDFLFNRSLRRSLWIRSDTPRANGVRGCPQFIDAIQKSILPTFEQTQLTNLSIFSPFIPMSTDSFDPQQPQVWKHRHNHTRQHTISDPLAQCMLLLASLSWPQALPSEWAVQVRELYESLGGRVLSEVEQQTQWQNTLSLLGFLEMISPPMYGFPPLLKAPPTRESDLPKVAPYLRLSHVTLDQLMNPSAEWCEVTNLHHETTLASPALSAIIPALNGEFETYQVMELIDALRDRYPHLFDVKAQSGATLVWPQNGLSPLSTSDQLYYLLQEAYELAILCE